MTTNTNPLAFHICSICGAHSSYEEYLTSGFTCPVCLDDPNWLEDETCDDCGESVWECVCE